MSNLRRRLLLDSPQYNKFEFEFTFDKVPSEVSGDKSFVHSIKGNSLVWNQLKQAFTTGTYQTVQVTQNADGTFTLDGTADASVNVFVLIDIVSGHKYYFSCYLLSGTATTSTIRGQVYGANILRIDTSVASPSAIGTATNSGTSQIRYHMSKDDVFSQAKFAMNFIDLTQMFGEGNEPSTVEEFEALYPLLYYDYNAGEIINNKTAAIETTGFNQWDEEWELGAIDPSTGENGPGTSFIRSKNHIPALPSSQYCVHYGNTAGTNLRLFYYDANGAFLSASNWQINNAVITTPASCGRIRFIVATSAYGSTYKDDICINISDANRNGTYEPYWKNTLNLNLTTLTGKLLDSQGQPTGNSVIINPEGMAGQGDWADYCIVEGGYITKIVKQTPRVAVDLGDLEWTATTAAQDNMYMQAQFSGIAVPSSGAVKANILCSRYPTIPYNDVYANTQGVSVASSNSNIRIYDSNFNQADSGSAFKTAMAGVKLIYQLATPETYLLDTPIPLTNRVDNGGTKRRLPEDTASAVSAPFACDIAYDTINTSTNSIERVNATEEFIYDSISIDKPVKRGMLTKIKGKSLVWNQLVVRTSGTTIVNGVKFTRDANRNSVTLSGEITNTYAGTTWMLEKNLIIGNKYIYYHNVLSNPNSISAKFGMLNQSGIKSAQPHFSIIFTAASTGRSMGIENANNGDDFTGIEIQYNIVDLTQMFGSGNEPSTVAEFEKLYPLSYYNYNAGTLINNTTSALEITGTNWKNTLNLNITSLTGKLNGEGNSVTIVPTGLKSAGTAYDYGIIEKGKLTKIVKCIGEVDMGTLSWSRTTSNGQYFLVTEVSDILLPTTEDERVQGLLCCQYIAEYGRLDTSSPDKTMRKYNNGKLYIRDDSYSDADTFKTAMNGVLLYYALATPQIYILDNPVPVSLLTYKGCTVKQLPENTSTVVTAPNVEVIKNQIH